MTILLSANERFLSDLLSVRQNRPAPPIKKTLKGFFIIGIRQCRWFFLSEVLSVFIGGAR
jgi:hypothetical protein